nr:hypothetical protein [Tanacetum cinerariifolium]
MKTYPSSIPSSATRDRISIPQDLFKKVCGDRSLTNEDGQNRLK